MKYTIKTSFREKLADNLNKYKKSIVFVTVLLIVLAIPVTVLFLQQQTNIRQHAAGRASTIVTINTTQPLGTIAQDFSGLSIEESYICKLLQVEASHPELDTLLKNLSPLVMRIGGNSSDQMSWNSTSTCSGSNSTVGTAAIDGIFTLARKTNMKIIWGVNLKANQPDVFAQEAAYVIQAGGSRLIGIEIGNEPNDYNISFASYKAAWESYFTAINALSPNAPIVGPSTSYGITQPLSSNWFSQFLNSEGSKVKLAAFHLYSLSPANATTQNLLSPTTANTFSMHTKDAVTAANTVNLPVSIGESNSVYHGGAPGVSDVFASTLWGLDYMFTAAENGIHGVYFHGSAGTNDMTYSPIGMNASGQVYVKPLYYAMFLFHNTTQNSTLISSKVTSPINIVSHAVITTDGKLNILLINKDQAADTTAQVSIPSGYLSGSDIRLQAPAVTSLAKDVTLGGSAITNNGLWIPSTKEAVQIANNAFTITIPHASAVVITLSMTTVPPTLTPIAPTLLTPTVYCLGSCLLTPTPTPANTVMPVPSTTQPVPSLTEAPTIQPSTQPTTTPDSSKKSKHKELSSSGLLQDIIKQLIELITKLL